MKRTNFLVKFSIYLIRNIWQKKVGKKYNKEYNIICRFYPSCSDYAILAIQKYGFIKGWIKAINRIKRCNIKNTATSVDYP